MNKRFLVYFWTTECGQFVKIGHCQSNLYDRGMGIRNGCPLPLSEYPIGVIFCEDKGDMLKTEKAIHRQFKADRTQGEWFHLTTEISEYIKIVADTKSGKMLVEKDRKILRKRENQRRSDPEDKERRRQYRQQPEVKERRREYKREYRQQPEVKASEKKKKQEYRQQPEVKKRSRAYMQEYRKRNR